MLRRLHGMRVHMCLGGLGITGLVALVSAFPRGHARGWGWRGGRLPPVCVSAFLFWGVFGVRVFSIKGAKLLYFFPARS